MKVFNLFLGAVRKQWDYGYTQNDTYDEEGAERQESQDCPLKVGSATKQPAYPLLHTCRHVNGCVRKHWINEEDTCNGSGRDCNAHEEGDTQNVSDSTLAVPTL